MLKVAAAFLLLLGSGLIFHALVAMDAPTFHPRLLKRRLLSGPTSNEPTEAPLRRAA
jgi:hypothetical protein